MSGTDVPRMKGRYSSVWHLFVHTRYRSSRLFLLFRRPPPPTSSSCEGYLRGPRKARLPRRLCLCDGVLTWTVRLPVDSGLWSSCTPTSRSSVPCLLALVWTLRPLSQPGTPVATGKVPETKSETHLPLSVISQLRLFTVLSPQGSWS